MLSKLYTFPLVSHLTLCLQGPWCCAVLKQTRMHRCMEKTINEYFGILNESCICNVEQELMQHFVLPEAFK